MPQALPLLAAEDPGVIRPARRAPCDALGRGPRADELVNAVEGALVVVLARAPLNELDQREQVGSEGAGLAVYLPVLDLLKMRALQIFPPAGVRLADSRPTIRACRTKSSSS